MIYAVLTAIIEIDEDRDLGDLTPRMVQNMNRYKGVKVQTAKLGAIRSDKGAPCQGAIAGVAIEVAKLATQEFATTKAIKAEPSES